VIVRLGVAFQRSAARTVPMRVQLTSFRTADVPAFSVKLPVVGRKSSIQPPWRTNPPEMRSASVSATIGRLSMAFASQLVPPSVMVEALA
jgi:hypothetical protein